MTTKTISTIDTDQKDELEPSDVIASLPHLDSAVWADCIASLRRIRRLATQNHEPLPTNATIDAVLKYLDTIRQETPWATPAWIRLDTEGGIAIEWYDCNDGVISTDTATFFNNGFFETVHFINDVAVRIETDRWDSAISTTRYKS